MYQKHLIRDAWKSAGLYDEDDPKLQQFLQLLDDPAQCWDELIQACRQNFAAYKAKITQPILDSSDPLVHLMVIRAATGTDELRLVEKFIAKSDPVRHEIELKAIAAKRVPRLNKALARKPDLTKAVSDAVRAQATRPARRARKRKPAAAGPAGGPAAGPAA